MAKVVTNANFADIIAGPMPVIVDFWATWCGPCRALSPVVDEIASEYEGRAEVAKCNVDDCEDVAAQYGIRSIPTLLFFKDGKMVDRLVGLVPKSQIASKVDSLL
jgi:thioredoxin 1